MSPLTLTWPPVISRRGGASADTWASSVPLQFLRHLCHLLVNVKEGLSPMWTPLGWQAASWMSGPLGPFAAEGSSRFLC